MNYFNMRLLMTKKKLNKMRGEIETIKTKLMALDIFRPGSITEQFKNPTEKTGGYHQLNYMHKMKSKSEYVRLAFLKELTKQTADYKIFRKLTDRWVELGIAYSKLEIKLKLEGKY